MIKKINPTQASGSCLIGYVKTTFSELKNLLGEPNAGPSGDGKVNVEWVLDVGDNSVCTIYDWKRSEVPTEEYNWHLGGKGTGILKKFEKLTGLKTSSALF